MLGVNQLDFINYCNALKGNYRKGVHKMETLLENPTHAKEFAKNLGGVSVVLGTPVGKEDRNSETLRSMLLASDVANDAVYTWMGQYYEFDSWDELLGDEDRCKAMMANELLWRALSASGVAMGKTVATLAGLSCSAYDDMSAVAASSTAMAAVINNSTALNAVVSSSTAMAAVASSQTAMAAVASSQTAMAAVASSQTAMAAVINNSTALNAVVSSSTAMAAVASSQTAMAAVASSQTAMAAVASSQTAMAAVASSQTAMAAIIANSTALNAVVSSSAAMSAVAASQTAMAAVASSQTAMAAVINSEAARTALVSSSVARKALKASSLAVEMSLVSSDGQYWNSIGTKTMRGLILYTKAGNTDNAFTITKVDSTTLASNNNARNAATSGSTGYKDWLEAFPNSSWVLSSITFYAYYRTTKIKYIPC
ncbi:MAG: hypothetical protein ACLTHM_06200 [Butyricicoccus sp.]